MAITLLRILVGFGALLGFWISLLAGGPLGLSVGAALLRHFVGG